MKKLLLIGFWSVTQSVIQVPRHFVLCVNFGQFWIRKYCIEGSLAKDKKMLSIMHIAEQYDSNYKNKQFCKVFCQSQDALSDQWTLVAVLFYDARNSYLIYKENYVNKLKSFLHDDYILAKYGSDLKNRYKLIGKENYEQFIAHLGMSTNREWASMEFLYKKNFMTELISQRLLAKIIDICAHITKRKDFKINPEICESDSDEDAEESPQHAYQDLDQDGSGTASTYCHNISPSTYGNPLHSIEDGRPEADVNSISHFDDAQALCYIRDFLRNSIICITITACIFFGTLIVQIAWMGMSNITFITVPRW